MASMFVELAQNSRCTSFLLRRLSLRQYFGVQYQSRDIERRGSRVWDTAFDYIRAVFLCVLIPDQFIQYQKN
jgi:hypothetical protein